MNASPMDVEELREAISYITVALTIVAVFVVVLTILTSLIYLRWGTQIMSLDDIRRLTKSHLQVAESVAKSTKQEVVTEVKEAMREVANSGSGIDHIRVHE